MQKKKIIISGINLFEGGPLSVIQDCLSFLNDDCYVEEYEITALVHKKEIFSDVKYENIKFLEFPKARKSYLYRIYYEYFYFKKIAKNIKPHFWFSLHDITPTLKNVEQAVYCHNPSPFQKVKIRDFFDQPRLFFFTLFYKYLYNINIKKNKFVVVQQMWIKDAFIKEFGLKSDKFIIAPPKIPNNLFNNFKITNDLKKENQHIFFYPTLPRPFKNIEVICEAVKLLLKENISDFQIIITITGKENNYSKRIVKKYGKIKNIKFIGRITREEVFSYYELSDCLLFSSKLETWGLPISEFKEFKKPILLSDLPYAKETGGNYDRLKFFDPESKIELYKILKEFIEGNIVFDAPEEIRKEGVFAHSWNELFLKLI